MIVFSKPTSAVENDGRRRNVSKERLRGIAAWQCCRIAGSTKLKRSEVLELHYIAHCATVPSILKIGILSHDLAEPLDPISVADPEVQARRHARPVEDWRVVHDYANLYFHARNPMIFRLINEYSHSSLAVVSVDPKVIDLRGVKIADGNAADSETRFWDRDEGLALLDSELVFAEQWTGWDYQEKKRIRCAEVLVPNKVLPRYIMAVYVSCIAAKQLLQLTTSGIPIFVSPYLFFL